MNIQEKNNEKIFLSTQDIVQPRANVKPTYSFSETGSLDICGDWFNINNLEVLINGKKNSLSWFLIEPETKKAYYKKHWIDLINFHESTNKNKPALLKKLAKNHDFLIKAPEFSLEYFVPIELLFPLEKIKEASGVNEPVSWNEEEAFLTYYEHLSVEKKEQLRNTNLKTKYGNFNLFEIALTLKFFEIAEKLYEDGSFFQKEHLESEMWLKILISQHRQEFNWLTYNINSLEQNAFIKQIKKTNFTVNIVENIFEKGNSKNAEPLNIEPYLNMFELLEFKKNNAIGTHEEKLSSAYHIGNIRYWLNISISHQKDLKYDGAMLCNILDYERNFYSSEGTLLIQTALDFTNKIKKEKPILFPKEKFPEFNSWEEWTNKKLAYSLNEQLKNGFKQLDLEENLKPNLTPTKESALRF